MLISSSATTSKPVADDATATHDAGTKDTAKDHLREKEADGAKAETVEDDRIPKLAFRCDTCVMTEMVHYYGREPPFAYELKLLEDTYMMRDPFAPPQPRWKPKPEYFIAMGAKCSMCQRTVCRDTECSIFYTRTYCLQCAAEALASFPSEVQAKIRKQTAAK